MLSSNPICPVCNYATSAVYCDLPTPEQLANGVKPLDSLPAAWWNKMWNMINCSVNQARGAVGSFITELNNVLAGAGICPNCVCTDQLYQAIDRIRQTIGNATVAGAVKSSSTPGMVSIDNNGFMTANCVGNATQLATSARTLVGAVNELKTTYDTCFGNVSTTLGGKAPTSHASSATTYGVGTSANYGHVKLSDSTASTSSTSGGTAATPAAVKAVQDSLNSNVNTLTTSISGKAPTSHASSATTYGVGTSANYGHLRISGTYTSDLKDAGMAASQSALYNVYNYATQISAAAIGLGNIAGCPLGTASAGTATTAARSDHVHPLPAITSLSGTLGIAHGGTGQTTANAAANAFLNSLTTGGDIPEDNDYYISQYVNGGTTTTSYHRRPVSKLWEYIKGKAPSALRVACATCAHSVIDHCDPATPIQIAYAGAGLTAAQVTHFAAFSTNLESGKTIIKDASRDTIKQVLGLGSAAYCDATALHVACAVNATCAVKATCADYAGVTCTFGNVTATINPTMRTWSVYALPSGIVTSAPECNIVKAICWATGNLSQGTYMTVSGYMDARTVICEIQKGTDGINIWLRSRDGTSGWTYLYATCTRSRCLPLSFGGSY